ncbi:MAG: hypothetical protein ACR2RE_24700 [Geminicoccaceae bacterium]
MTKAEVDALALHLEEKTGVSRHVAKRILRIQRRDPNQKEFILRILKRARHDEGWGFDLTNAVLRELTTIWFPDRKDVNKTSCRVCDGILASNVKTCIHCGANTLIGYNFAFRDELISWYTCIVPKGQFKNVVSQLRDDYEQRIVEFGCTKSASRKANLWLMGQMARDLAPLGKRMLALLGGGLGLGVALRWIQGRDD